MRLVLFLLFLLAVLKVPAQHCPLDGSSLVAIRLVDAKGNLLQPGRDTVFLKEVENENPARCSYAAELLKLPFLDTATLFSEYKKSYGAVYDSYLRRQFSTYKVPEQASLMVILSQAQESCMIENKNDFDYVKRKFVVYYYHDKKLITVPVKETDIRHLCTGSSQMREFRPVVVRVF